MAATGKHVRGSAIVIDPARVGTLEQFVSKERPPVKGKQVRTTWECLNCGNGLVSTRGISRCPRCGSHEVVHVVAPVAQHQQAPIVRERLDLPPDDEPDDLD